MPILTDEQKATLAARLSEPDCAGLSAAAAADLLNAPTAVPNPDPQPTVPRTISGREVLGMLSAASRQGVMSAGLLPHLDNLAWGQARDRIAAWIDDILAPNGIASADDASAVKSYLAAADPDPSWQPTVPGPSWAVGSFPGVEFRLADGRLVVNAVAPEMVAEARA